MVVRWIEKDDVSVLPIRKAVKPEPSAVMPGAFGKVKSSSTKAYPAELLPLVSVWLFATESIVNG